MKLVLATNNTHKVKEIRAILRRQKIKLPLLTLAHFPKRKPVVENKPTIEGNAIKKAKEVAKFAGCLALADDTGLFIDALKGKPGVYSARFAGPQCNYVDNCQKTLGLLKKVPSPKRGATFRTIAALATPDGHVCIVEGRIRGKITTQMRGKKGFGYDPVFYVPRLKKTLAQMSLTQKNQISHRGHAFKKVPRILRTILRRQSNSDR